LAASLSPAKTTRAIRSRQGPDAAISSVKFAFSDEKTVAGMLQRRPA
jgi:hypothetical protein